MRTWVQRRADGSMYHVDRDKERDAVDGSDRAIGARKHVHVRPGGASTMHPRAQGGFTQMTALKQLSTMSLSLR